MGWFQLWAMTKQGVVRSFGVGRVGSPLHERYTKIGKRRYLNPTHLHSTTRSGPSPCGWTQGCMTTHHHPCLFVLHTTRGNVMAGAQSWWLCWISLSSSLTRYCKSGGCLHWIAIMVRRMMFSWLPAATCHTRSGRDPSANEVGSQVAGSWEPAYATTCMSKVGNKFGYYAWLLTQLRHFMSRLMKATKR